MQVTVKLFSVFQEHIPNYDPSSGMMLELPDGTSVAHLLRHLNLPEGSAPVVTCNGRILKQDDVPASGSVLHIFQPVAGG